MRLDPVSQQHNALNGSFRGADISSQFRSEFAELASDPVKFSQLFSEAFGESHDAQAAESLRQKTLEGDFSWLPDVEYLPTGELNGALGAYNANTDTIFINDDLIGTAAAQDVYIEEVGHYIDTVVNTADTQGDEGEHFHALILGVPVSSSQLQAIRSDNDHGRIVVDGQVLNVDFRQVASDHIVRSGDTLSGIAQQHGISLSELLGVNPQIINPNLIYVGQQINLPTAASAHVPSSYTVSAGDTLGAIAREQGISLSALLSANPQISNPDRIYVGQQINLPAGEPGPTAPVPGDVEIGGDVPVGNIDIDALVQAVPASIRNARGDAIEVDIARIVAVAQREGLSQEQTAYVLATATHESHLGRFMEEIASGAAYEGRSDLGNTQPGDGVRFKGRGYVQITGRANYQDWSNRLGIDLVSNPELAEDPDIAAEILVIGMMDGSFTGRALDTYINDSGADFVEARRVVNGTDRADLIAGYADAFNTALDQTGPVESEPANTAPVSTVTVGVEGSDADLWTKHTADIDNLDAVIIETFDDIVAVWAEAGAPTPVITSGNDGVHSNGSFHYHDLAIDLRANNISDSQAQAIADALSDRLGADFDVIFERFPNHPANDHIHLEFDPD